MNVRIYPFSAEWTGLNEFVQDSQTPLYVASENGHAEVFKVLLAAGARTDVKTEVRSFL